MREFIDFVKEIFSSGSGRGSSTRIILFMLAIGALGFTSATIYTAIKNPQELNINMLAHNLELWTMAIGGKWITKQTETISK